MRLEIKIFFLLCFIVGEEGSNEPASKQALQEGARWRAKLYFSNPISLFFLSIKFLI